MQTGTYLVGRRSLKCAMAREPIGRGFSCNGVMQDVVAGITSTSRSHHPHTTMPWKLADGRRRWKWKKRKVRLWRIGDSGLQYLILGWPACRREGIPSRDRQTGRPNADVMGRQVFEPCCLLLVLMAPRGSTLRSLLRNWGLGGGRNEMD